MKRLNLLNTRKIVLVLMLLGLALLLLADYIFEAGSTIRNIFIWSGAAMFLVVIVLMGVGFKCPQCGCRFFKASLFLKKLSPVRCRFHSAQDRQRYDSIEGRKSPYLTAPQRAAALGRGYMIK